MILFLMELAKLSILSPCLVLIFKNSFFPQLIFNFTFYGIHNFCQFFNGTFHQLSLKSTKNPIFIQNQPGDQAFFVLVLIRWRWGQFQITASSTWWNQSNICSYTCTYVCVFNLDFANYLLTIMGSTNCSLLVHMLRAL